MRAASCWRCNSIKGQRHLGTILLRQFPAAAGHHAVFGCPPMFMTAGLRRVITRRIADGLSDLYPGRQPGRKPTPWCSGGIMSMVTTQAPSPCCQRTKKKPPLPRNSLHHSTCPQSSSHYMLYPRLLVAPALMLPLCLRPNRFRPSPPIALYLMRMAAANASRADRGQDPKSGCFGCQYAPRLADHARLDIRCLERDKRNEPTDPVMATAANAVAYVNRLAFALKPRQLPHPASRRGRPRSVFGLRALAGSARRPEARRRRQNPAKPSASWGAPPTRTKASPKTARMFTLNEPARQRPLRHPSIKKTFPKQRNDHGQWKWAEPVGIDPRAIFLEQKEQGAKFNLVRLIQSQPELCRVMVRDTIFAG